MHGIHGIPFLVEVHLHQRRRSTLRSSHFCHPEGSHNKTEDAWSKCKRSVLVQLFLCDSIEYRSQCPHELCEAASGASLERCTSLTEVLSMSQRKVAS